MNNDGVVRGPSFDFKDAPDGRGIERAGGKAIDCFCRQRHDFACAQEFRSAPGGGGKQLRRVRRENRCVWRHCCA
jgi:hypothetical protein